MLSVHFDVGDVVLKDGRDVDLCRVSTKLINHAAPRLIFASVAIGAGELLRDLWALMGSGTNLGKGTLGEDTGKDSVSVAMARPRACCPRLT